MVRRTPRHTRPDTLFPFTTHCRSPRLPLSALFRVSPVGVAGCMTVGIANGAFWALGPAFVLQSGLHVSDVALFMSATVVGGAVSQWPFGRLRSEEHTSELQSLMRISYAVFCLKKKKQ